MLGSLTTQGVEAGLAAFLALCTLQHARPLAEVIFNGALAVGAGVLVALAVSH
jgi:hypothetical protein